MDLDLFKNLINSTKENKIVQNFINELTDALEENFERNEIPLVQRILNGRKLTAKYRDEINIQRVDVIKNYSKETSDKGKLYYIYSKNSDNTYNIGIKEAGKSCGEIEIKESQLPVGAGVDSILRVKNEKFILDKEATQQVEEKMTEIINRLLEEQDRMLDEQRVEGHLYEFVERSGDTAWLIDKTDYTGDCFQEVDFSSEVFANAKQGDIFQYVNGEYKFYSN